MFINNTFRAVATANTGELMIIYALYSVLSLNDSFIPCLFVLKDYVPEHVHFRDIPLVFSEEVS